MGDAGKKETHQMGAKNEAVDVELGKGLGWLRDHPDIRDYTMETKEVEAKFLRLGQKNSIKAMLKQVGVVDPDAVKLQPSADLRAWCTEIKDQGALGSCTANAGGGVVEYYEQRAFGKHIDASRLFLYKVTRNLLGWHGDTGAYLRTTMGGLALFGIPPERYYPYVISDFDNEPSAFCYSLAGNYQAIQYFRLDSVSTSVNTLLTRIKVLISAGLPSMFGFTVYSSYVQAGTTGQIPYPCPGERTVGGHAIVAVGYDDAKKIKNANCNSETTGALLIRNSWGTGWGDHGYGWLPYEYVLKGQAVDWWCLLKNEWVNTGLFGL
jgi:C1A family cysteine protease